jgi:hypothetical protein
MKTLYRFLSMIMCGMFLMTAFSCTKEEGTNEGIDGSTDGTDIPEGYEKITLSATCDSGDDAEVGSKTALDNGNTVWSAEDVIKVYYGSSSSNFELTSGAGTRNGLFSGVASSAPEYAVYPAGVSSSLSGSTVSVTIPAEQDGSFGSGNIAVAKVNNLDLAFKNINAFLKITTSAAIHHVVVTSVNGEALAGIVPVTFSNGDPNIGSITSHSSSVTLTTNNVSGTFFISVIAAQSHSKGLLIEYYSNGSTLKNTYYLRKNITTTRSKIFDLGALEPSGTGGTDYYVTENGNSDGSGLDWANAMSAAKMWSLLSGDSDESKEDAKIAAINGATFHLASGSYDWYSKNNNSNPTVSFDDQVSFTIEGGYNPSTGDRNITNNVTSFTGNGSHQILLLSGNMDVTFDGISFVNGYNSGDGGGVVISSGSWSFTDCSFSNNHSGRDGGALSLSAGNTTLTHCTFTNNTALNESGDGTRTSGSGYGGAIDCYGTATLTIVGGSFIGNNAWRGGAVNKGGSGSLNVNVNAGESATSFSGNGSANTQLGGAVRVGGSGNCTFTNCSFSSNEAYNNNADNDGEGTNIPEGFGGAIHREGTGNFYVIGGSFSGNKAWRGAALNIAGGNGTLTITGATFSENGAAGKTRNGGVAYVQRSVIFNDCTMDGNVAKYGAAFGLYYSGATLTINGGSIANHSSECGGAIDQDLGSLVIGRYTNQGTLITGNSCTSGDKHGGFLCVTPKENRTASVQITGATFKGNHVSSDGGAIFMAGEGNPSLSLIECVFGGQGAGDPNYSDECGGVFYFGKGTATITDCSFINNHAYTDTWDRSEIETSNPETPGKGYGGAIYCTGSASLIINKDNGSGTSFSGSKAWRGGAIFCNSSGTNTFTSASFSGNGTRGSDGVTRNGGALYVRSSMVTLNGCNLSDNAANWGGAIVVDDGTAIVNLNGGILQNNTSSGIGGAIEVDTGKLIVDRFNSVGTQFIGNYSENRGGAIAFETNNQEKINSIKGAVFKGNHAPDGGALYAISSNTRVTISECTFGGSETGEPNYSTNRGGAIYNSGATLTVEGGTFYGNHAPNGGAIMKENNASLTITRDSNGVGTVFEGNYVAATSGKCWGGAIYSLSKNGNFSCTGATFRQNRINYIGTDACYGGAIAIASNNGLHADIIECLFDGNSSACNGGSALSYQSSNGSSMGDKTGYMRVINCRFVGNHTDYQQSMGNENEIGRHGGAVRLGHDATWSYFDGCTFSGNYTETAGVNRISAYGGAITYYADGMAYLNNCYFEGNYATRGGAISTVNCGSSGLYLNACSFSGNWNSCCGGTTIVACGPKTFCMNNCSFNDNTYLNSWTDKTLAREGGSWIYISGSSEYGMGNQVDQDKDRTLEELVISNCTMIGTCRKTSSLTEISEDGRELIYVIEMVNGKSMYLINNALINIKANDPAASTTLKHDAWWTNGEGKSEGTHMNLIGYNNIWNTAGLTASTYDLANKGNSGYYNDKASTPTYNRNITKALLGNPSWNSTRHVWPWGGSLTSGSYSMITASNFDSYMLTASSDFKAWLEDVDPGPTVKNMLHTDQLGNSRDDTGCDWRPGAYASQQ